MIAACVLAAGIVGGTADAGDPAVVAIAHHPVDCGDPPAVLCSGLLVSSRVVITAAHCLDGQTLRGGLEIVFGADVSAPDAIVLVESGAPYSGYDPDTGDGDVAALLLATDAPIAPYAGGTGSIADAAAQSDVRAVGFGVTSSTANDPGVKRTGTMQLSSVSAGTFDAVSGPAMTCAADSGGPVFATLAAGEQLVGVTSRGDAACAAIATTARADVVQAPFIDPFVQSSAGAPPGWPSTVPFGATSCTSDTDCPALMTCSGDGTCALPWLGAGRFGGTCASDSDCGGDRCARVWPDGADACHCFAASMPPPPPPPDAGEPPPPPDATGCCNTGDGGSVWLALLLFTGSARRRR